MLYMLVRTYLIKMRFYNLGDEMATNITTTNIRPTIFVTASSRFAKSSVIQYGDNQILTFTTYKRNNRSTSSSDKFTIVPAGEEYRPDLTSYRAYNTVDYWWLIMEFNGIFDVYDYRAGLNLRIPSANNLI